MSEYISADAARDFVRRIQKHLGMGYNVQRTRQGNIQVLKDLFHDMNLTKGWTKRSAVEKLVNYIVKTINDEEFESIIEDLDRFAEKLEKKDEAYQHKQEELITDRKMELEQLPQINDARDLLEQNLPALHKKRSAKQLEKDRERELTGLKAEHFEEEPHQQERLDKILNQLQNVNTDRVNLEGFNKDDLTEIQAMLLNYFNNVLAKEEVINREYERRKIYIHFWFYGQKNPKSYIIDVSTWQLLKNALEAGTIFTQIESIASLFFDPSGGMNEESFQWNFVREFAISDEPLYTKGYKTRKNGFLPYVLKKGKLSEEVYKEWKDQLKRYQIFTDIANHKEQLEDCCFVYALKMAGVDEDVINKIKLTRINDRTLTYSIVDKICKENKIKLLIREIKLGAKSRANDSHSSPKGYTGPDPAYDIVLDAIADHFLLHEKTFTTTSFIKAFPNVSADCMRKRKVGDSWKSTSDESRYVDSGNLVKWMIEHEILKPITFGDYDYIPTIKKPTLDEVESLEYNPSFCISDITRDNKRKESCSKNEPKEYSYWFADFEADVTGQYHQAFMCCLQSEDGRDKKTFVGEDCGEQLLKYLPPDSVVYFHNLGYDCCFLAKYGATGKPIQKSASKTITMNIFYNNKLIHLRDSLALINAKLADFPKMFGLKDIQKERFPYKYYTVDRLKDNIGTIAGCGNEEDKPWGVSEYEEFVHNIDNIPGCRLSPTTFDMIKYCEFYCQQDVSVLREGYNFFRENILKEFDLDIHNILTVSSIAYQYISKKVFINPEIKSSSGIVDQVIRKTIYGGRCMTAGNRCYHIKKRLQDNDAVSLYAAAMARMVIPLGEPKLIKDLSYSFLEKQDFYVVEVEITKVKKKRTFPLIVMNDGFTNINTNGDGDDVFGVKNPAEFIISEEHPYRCWLNKISLEDLIEFQHIEYKVLRGYYWDEGVDTSIQEVIRKMFLTRKQYKSEGNPVQNIYKLILNSVYGKTIQKPIEDEIVYKWKDEAAAYRQKNYFKIIEETEIADSNTVAFKVRKASQFQFSYSLVGSIVLAMSKRIMNEVMCLAEDVGCHIYYQDTDSMHIEVDDIPKLEAAFKEKYGRELKGKDLGQFHCDFDSDKGEVVYSEESYILAKKLYMDVLRIKDGQLDLHVRGKGLKRTAIDAVARSASKNNDLFAGTIEVYKRLYEGESI